MTPSDPTPGTPPTDPAPLLTVRTTVVLLSAAVIGLVTGGLAFLGGGPTAGAVLAGLTASGAGVPALHKLIR
ncbi:hypothetical protein ACFCX4_05415 [Kitasatospora sp. NPDC056327]|uniref:hypothetical protein n=1 Tax=Kitasatospora sp. NPDC056327 TaxID=3345785 RepID=UPI0035E31FD5